MFDAIDFKWNQYNIYGKINIVTDLAHFENDKELLEFLICMED